MCSADLAGPGAPDGGGGGGSTEVSLQRSWGKHLLFSLLPPPLLAPFIKHISILKAVRNPSVQRLLHYLTPCFPQLLVYCSLINPPEGANSASGSSTEHPGLKGVPWGTGVGGGCVQRQIQRGRAPEQLQITHTHPQLHLPRPLQGLLAALLKWFLFLFLTQVGPG